MIFTNDQLECKKVSSLIIEKMVITNHNEISHHTVRMTCYQKLENQSDKKL